MSSLFEKEGKISKYKGFKNSLSNWEAHLSCKHPKESIKYREAKAEEAMKKANDRDRFCPSNSKSRTTTGKSQPKITEHFRSDSKRKYSKQHPKIPMFRLSRSWYFRATIGAIDGEPSSQQVEAPSSSTGPVVVVQQDEGPNLSPAPDGARPVAEVPPAAPLRVLGPDSRVDELRDRLKTLRKPIYGTKAEMYNRLVAAESEAELLRRERDWLEQRTLELREGQGPIEIMSAEIPEKPSEAEQEKHNLAHLPPVPWCEICLLARSTAAPHATITESKTVMAQFQLGFNFYAKNGELMKVETGQQPPDSWGDYPHSCGQGDSEPDSYYRADEGR